MSPEDLKINYLSSRTIKRIVMPVNVRNIEMMLWKLVFKYQLGRVARTEPREFFRLPIQCLKCARSSKAVDSHDRNIPAPCQDQGSASRVELIGNCFLSQNKKQFKAFCFLYIRTKPPQNLSNLECEDLPISQDKLATVDLPVPGSNSHFLILMQGHPPLEGLDFPCSN